MGKENKKDFRNEDACHVYLNESKTGTPLHVRFQSKIRINYVTSIPQSHDSDNNNRTHCKNKADFWMLRHFDHT